MAKVLGLTVDLQNIDEELVEQARCGSRAAFDELFARHKRFVYNICYSILGSADDAVDATQTSFIRAYNSLPKFRGTSSFRTWIYRITANTAVEMSRRRKRRQEVMDERLDIAMPEHSDDRVWEAMFELPPDIRSVLVLFYIQGLSCDELAETLGCSPGCIRTRLHRARQVFKKKYEEICQ